MVGLAMMMELGGEVVEVVVLVLLGGEVVEVVVLVLGASLVSVMSVAVKVVVSDLVMLAFHASYCFRQCARMTFIDTHCLMK